VAVKLGYQDVYRDPLGFPEWQKAGLPVASDPLGRCDYAPEAYSPGPLSPSALVWTLLGIFLGGMALNLTPCVYPIIPITISYFSGKSGQGQGRLLGHGLLYLAGLAVANSALGVAAALTRAATKSSAGYFGRETGGGYSPASGTAAFGEVKVLSGSKRNDKGGQA
jgi:thiol:disulfide interchange protein DsbD